MSEENGLIQGGGQHEAGQEEAVVSTDNTFLDTGFGEVMDAILSEEDGQKDDQAAEEDSAVDVGEGLPAQPVEDLPGAATAAVPTAGELSGAESVPTETVTSNVDASTFAQTWSDMSNGLVDRQGKAAQAEAISEARETHAAYFEALNKHPLELVGTEVPRIGGADGEMTVLRDGADAKEWQEAINTILRREIVSNTRSKVSDMAPNMEVLQNSVDIFRRNMDLVPGTKQFDVELANAFAKIATPYERRSKEGKLIGYTIQVQPLIDAVRSQVAGARTAAAPTPRQTQAASQTRNQGGQFVNPDQPQTGIQSQAGQSGNEGEDFSTLFGTIGMPNIRI